MTPCRYFDGRSSRARAVSAAVEGGALRLVGDGVDLLVHDSDLTFSPPNGRSPARIAFAAGGLCELHDRDASESLFAALGYRRPAVERLVSRTWQVVSISVVFIAVMAALYVRGIPWLSDRIVERAPASWDADLGGKILSTLDRRQVFRPSGLPQPMRDRIVQRFGTLHLPPDGLTLRILFRKLGSPNAFALPGGVIVLSDEIVRLADEDDDAILTVLAHEVGHVAHRDALRQLARATVTSALAVWYLGDFSSAAAVAAGGLGTLRYGRRAEHEADLYAVRVMHASGISTRSAATLFRRLEAWQPQPNEATGDSPDKATRRAPTKPRERPRFPEYLGTHPDTDGRIRLFESDGSAAAAQP